MQLFGKNSHILIGIGLLSSILFLILPSAKAQSLQPNQGARAMAMGYAAVTNSDHYAWSNNPAGAANLKDITACGGFYHRFAMKSMNTAQLQVSVPIRKIVTGVSFQKYGDQYYSEQQAGLGLASRIGIVSLGTQFHVLQIKMDEMPTNYAWIGEFGGIASLGKHLSWGAHVWNFNLAKLNTTHKFELPIVMRTGVSYQPTTKLQGNIEVSKHINYQSSLHVGLEYKVVEWLALRTGVSTKPVIACFGAGVQSKKLKLDYAFTSHNLLGFSHQMSVAIVFHTKEKSDVTKP